MQRFEHICADHNDAVRAYMQRQASDELVDDVLADIFARTLANERRRPAWTAPAQR